MKGCLAWNGQWYSLEGDDPEPLPIPFPNIILPESLRALRASNTSEIEEKMIPWSEETLNQNTDFLDFSTRDDFRDYPSEGAIIADFPRNTWIPLSLLDEWPEAKSSRGVITDDASATDLYSLFESVCGPLSNERLGWQRIPELEMAQIFAMPSSLAFGYTADSQPLNLHCASALWALYWLDSIRNTEITGRHLSVIAGERDFGLWIYDGLRLVHQGRYLWNTTMDLLYHVLARRSDGVLNCLHSLQDIAWTAEERGILNTSFDHIFMHPASSGDSDLHLVRNALSLSLQKWHQRYG